LLEADQNRVLNAQTNVVMKIDGEVANLALEVQAIDTGIKTVVSHINKDLEALDQCVNCQGHSGPSLITTPNK